MRICPIARLRRLESRFLGQNGPRSSEMRFYIEITGYIKNRQKFKILLWSRESEKRIFTIFPEFFRSRPGLARTGGCRDPGSRNRQPAASARGNGFSVLRIFLIAAGSSIAAGYLSAGGYLNYADYSTTLGS